MWVAHPKSTPRGVRILLGVARCWCAWAVGSLRQLLLDDKAVQRAIFISKTVFFNNYFFVGGWLVAFILVRFRLVRFRFGFYCGFNVPV